MFTVVVVPLTLIDDLCDMCVDPCRRNVFSNVTKMHLALTISPSELVYEGAW
jgi:hypothetical protein